MPPVAPRINNFMAEVPLNRARNRPPLANERRRSDLLEEVETVDLGPEFRNSSIFDPEESHPVVRNSASGGNGPGKRSAMGPLQLPPDGNTRTFHHHILYFKMEVGKS